MKSFSLVIIEYLLDTELKDRETYWIKNFKPYYIILKEGYNSLGYRDTIETKAILKDLALGKLHS